jgi:hypothetical protein
MAEFVFRKSWWGISLIPRVFALGERVQTLIVEHDLGHWSEVTSCPKKRWNKSDENSLN